MDIDQLRIEASARLPNSDRSRLGQFFTPSSIALHMAGMFSKTVSPVSLLEAGAGVGALLHAACARMEVGSIEAWEIDDTLVPYLEQVTSELCDRSVIHNADFLLEVGGLIREGRQFDRVILNPPYLKIGTGSPHRVAVEELGVRTVNLYTAFVAASLMVLRNGGEMVAIIPRSCLNGVYHQPFREFLLKTASIDAVHVFHSRRSAFSDDGVLQENVIVKITKAGIQGDVLMSSSTDASFSDLSTFTVPFGAVVSPTDARRFVRIPRSLRTEGMSVPTCALSGLGIEVSTGPAVEFRISGHAAEPGEGIPIVGPKHLGVGGMVHPSAKARLNAVLDLPALRGNFWPSGHYVLVKRISSKESPRRIMAYHVDTSSLGTGLVAFENHVNVFHSGKHGLREDLAARLCAYLNSAEADDEFRSFSGSTQVNATDLKSMSYPCSIIGA